MDFIYLVWGCHCCLVGVESHYCDSKRRSSRCFRGANFYRQGMHVHVFDYSSTKIAPCPSPSWEECSYLPGEDLEPKAVITKAKYLNIEIITTLRNYCTSTLQDGSATCNAHAMYNVESKVRLVSVERRSLVKSRLDLRRDFSWTIISKACARKFPTFPYRLLSISNAQSDFSRAI